MTAAPPNVSARASWRDAACPNPIYNRKKMMKNRMMLLALCAGLSLSGCSSVEEKLCRANVMDGLLNPETAQFSDFKAITPKEIASDEFLSFMPKLMSSQIPQQGATYYRMRVRAEGKLGNKITKNHFCAVDAAKAKCACTATD